MKQPSHILIIEDELLVALDLKERLKQSGYHVVALADNYDDAIHVFKEYLPDLVLIDISINGDKNGIDIANEINNIMPTPFIFITAHTDVLNINKAKNTSPAAYIIKPFTTNSLLVAIELALHKAEHGEQEKTEDSLHNDDNIYVKDNHVFIKDGYRYFKVFINDIYYFTAEANYVKIVTEKKSFLIRNSLTNTIDRLQKKYFVRIHRSSCINTNQIDSFTESEVIVKGKILAIGRNYKDELKNSFKS